jgi:hypothetical protein
MKLTLSNAWLWRRGGGGAKKRLRLRDGKRLPPRIATPVVIEVRTATLRFRDARARPLGHSNDFYFMPTNQIIRVPLSVGHMLEQVLPSPLHRL